MCSWMEQQFPDHIIKNVEQGGPGYGPQAAAMHTLPLAAQVLSTARGPIQTPDVRQKME